MTNENMLNLTNRLGTIVNLPISFNRLDICVTYVGRAKHSAQWVIQSHYHPWFEFNYVQSGSVYTTLDGKEFLVTKGQSYLIPPGKVHSHRHNNTGDDGLCIRFSVVPSTDGNDEAAKIHNILSVCRREPFESEIGHFPVSDGIYGTKAAFVTWLMRLYDKFKNDTETETDNFDSVAGDKTIASQVKLYLKEYYKEHIRVEDIAAALNISYRSLARRFKAETGLTVSGQLTHFRIEAAKQLLKDSNMTLYDIAAAVGYENEFYFSKMFKKTENVSPSEYRRR